jgi:hypothetical protein
VSEGSWHAPWWWRHATDRGRWPRVTTPVLTPSTSTPPVIPPTPVLAPAPVSPVSIPVPVPVPVPVSLTLPVSPSYTTSPHVKVKQGCYLPPYALCAPRCSTTPPQGTQKTLGPRGTATNPTRKYPCPHLSRSRSPLSPRSPLSRSLRSLGRPSRSERSLSAPLGRSASRSRVSRSRVSLARSPSRVSRGRPSATTRRSRGAASSLRRTAHAIRECMQLGGGVRVWHAWVRGS